ncbi:MAG: Cys-tRNA(Pro) deacylase [Butyribacter sp.]|nr:Cys-tRNA(Pro) deacylase [bacterium]MDY3854150.1 Cys-tRNA(Pro) deacylase [Butyribacter sp.]
MGKEVKTNAMRILDRNKIPYRINLYECDEFIDGVHIADKLGQDYDMTFKTLVMVGKSRQYYVFAIPIDQEVDMKKAAKVVGEKSLEMVHVKDINQVTGYIRGGCTPIGMKKNYPTVIQESAKNFEEIIVSGGRLGTQIFLAPDDLLKVTKGIYADVIVS